MSEIPLNLAYGGHKEGEERGYDKYISRPLPLIIMPNKWVFWWKENEITDKGIILRNVIPGEGNPDTTLGPLFVGAKIERYKSTDSFEMDRNYIIIDANITEGDYENAKIIIRKIEG